MFSLSGNTVLITGGGSGIGRAFAEALHAGGNTVIISGRNPNKLNKVERANPGIVARELDVDDPVKIDAFARQILKEFPSLNIVVNNAGVMIPEDVRSGDITKAEATISTNLLAPIRVTASLLPHLLGRQSGAVFSSRPGWRRFRFRLSRLIARQKRQFIPMQKAFGINYGPAPSKSSSSCRRWSRRN